MAIRLSQSLLLPMNLLSSGYLCHDLSLANSWHFSEIRCPDPVVRNAMHVNEWYKTGRYMYGDSVKIVCNEGYTVKDYGSNVALRCTSKGTWEPAVTECTAGRQRW